MADLRQSAFGGDPGGDPESATFASAPVEGNLAVAIVSERSGGTATNQVLTGITGWTHVIAETTEQSAGSFRRSFSVFIKVLEASESSTVTVDDGTSSDKWLSIAEFEPSGTDDQFVLLESASNDNGQTNNANTIATGTTASVSETRYLTLGAMIMRNPSAASDATTTSWATQSLTVAFNFGDSSGGDDFDMGHHLAFDGADTVNGIKQSTCSLLTNTNNTGLNAGIVVISLVATTLTPEIVVSPQINVLNRKWR